MRLPRLFGHRPGPRAELIDVVCDPSLRRWEELVVLRALATEALVLQDQAEQVIRDVRNRVMLGIVARRGGPLIRRYFALQDELPGRCREADLDTCRAELRVIFANHAMQMSVALDLLAAEWRSPRIGEQLDALEGLGVAATELERIYTVLSAAD